SDGYRWPEVGEAARNQIRRQMRRRPRRAQRQDRPLRPHGLHRRLRRHLHGRRFGMVARRAWPPHPVRRCRVGGLANPRQWAGKHIGGTGSAASDALGTQRLWWAAVPVSQERWPLIRHWYGRSSRQMRDQRIPGGRTSATQELESASMPRIFTPDGLAEEGLE